MQLESIRIVSCYNTQLWYLYVNTNGRTQAVFSVHKGYHERSCKSSDN